MGFSFNKKHNYNDFGLIMESKSIQSPSKKKIKMDVPFMNGSYDFSTVGSNGEITYTERNITMVLALPTLSKQRLHVLYSKVLEWLQGTGQNKIIFDDIPDYYFMGEVETSSAFEEVAVYGKLTVTFICEPFKTGTSIEGTNQLWDTFNFETDYLQITDFDVAGSKNITIYNLGRSVSPMISASVAMSVTINGNTFSLSKGDNTDFMFKLKNGANTIVATGNGKIGFYFRKQVL